MTVYSAMPSRGQAFISCLLRALQNTALVPGSEMGCAESAAATITRNTLVTQFLRTKHDWIWFVDDDTLVPEDALPQLLATAERHDAALVTGVTPFGYPPILNVQRPGVKGWLAPWPQGEFPITACGTSCVLIHRRVFEAVEFPWFNYYQDQFGDIAQSEDVPFCFRAAEAGFRLWCNAEIRCGHFKYLDVLKLCPPIPGASNVTK